MKFRKTTIHKYNLIKMLYNQYKSCAVVGRILKLHRTTIMYWLGKTKKSPKYKFSRKTPTVSINDYKAMILANVNADTENPKEIGRQLRKEFKQDFGIYPENVKLDK